MIYVRVWTTAGKRLYHKVEVSDFKEARRRLRKTVSGYDRAERIDRQDYEVGLLEMDIQANSSDSLLEGLRPPSGLPPEERVVSWSSLAAGFLSFVFGIAVMIFWSVRDLDLRRSIIILVLSGILIVMGLIYLVVGLIGRRR